MTRSPLRTHHSFQGREEGVVRRSICALAALSLLPFPASALVVIDSFDGPAGGQSVSIASGPPDDDFDVATGTGAIGDERVLAVLVLSTPPGSIVLGEANTPASSGAYRFTTSLPIPRARAFIHYEGGFDLDLSGESEIVFRNVSTSGLTSLNLSLNARFEEGEISSGYGIQVPAGFHGDVRFDLSRFEGDMRHVDGVHVTIDTYWPEAGDVRFEGIVAVPEPSTLLLLGLGVAIASQMRPRSRG